MRDTDVLIIGAGPTGLVLALWLTRLGVGVRIVDKTARAGTTSRALAVHARTLELYRQLGLADEVVARGRKSGAVNLWVAGRARGPCALGTSVPASARIPSVLIFPQDEHEALLIERLHAGRRGRTADRPPGLTRRGPCARRGSGGTARDPARHAYIAGCDGARSVVRETLGIGFPGGTYEQIVLRRRRRGSRPAVERRAARGPRRGRFPGRVPA